jgi:RNA polymerase sigma-70 factor (ECF subfamily)
MEAIVAEHETALLRYATRIVNNPVTAQDVVQNVFVKLFQGWQKGTRPSSRLKAWLYRVTHNEAVDQIRRESRLRLLHEKRAAEPTLECADGHNCPVPLEDRRQLVLSVLGTLHPGLRQVVLLRLEEGLSYKEIAQVTGRTTGSVSSALHSAVRQLGEKLREADARLRDADTARPDAATEPRAVGRRRRNGRQERALAGH